MVAKVINLALRGLEFVFSLLVMALIGNMIADASSGNPSVVNYSIFVSVFGMLTLFYLIPATVMDSLSLHPLFMVVIDALNSIFWFCAAVAMAAILHVHSCGNLEYLNTNSITNGAVDKGKRCHEAQASTAFLWFGWACFTASAVFSGIQGRGSGPVRGKTSRV